MANNVVQKCMGIIDGDEVNFLACMLNADIPGGHRDECVELVNALAQADPTYFVATVGRYLIDGVEVE